jgi:hypothetical protein
MLGYSVEGTSFDVVVNDSTGVEALCDKHKIDRGERGRGSGHVRSSKG